MRVSSLHTPSSSFSFLSPFLLPSLFPLHSFSSICDSHSPWVLCSAQDACMSSSKGRVLPGHLNLRTCLSILAASLGPRPALLCLSLSINLSPTYWLYSRWGSRTNSLFERVSEEASINLCISFQYQVTVPPCPAQVLKYLAGTLSAESSGRKSAEPVTGPKVLAGTIQRFPWKTIGIYPQILKFKESPS